MARIRALDEETINKIAAGEVIERPASAVKELVENSIDAGARRILIEIKDGGKSFIRVTDDGCGIDPEDLPLAFQKHATSKITGADDLDRIKTLGFRGEALASIASVSSAVEVRTKTRDAISGTYLRLENGKTSEVKEVGSPAGTSITVWNLFHNIPARRKHLKGSEAELVHITDVVTELAIIHYDIAFELFSGRHTYFKSARSDSWDGVLLRLFGLKAVQGLSPFQTSGRGWKIVGVVGDAFSLRSSPDGIFIFVNGRAISSRPMTSALREAYRNIIPSRKSPIAVLSLEISTELVDVNVHPAKREIRLLLENEICSAVTEGAAQALSLHAKSRAAEQMDRILSAKGFAASEETVAESTLQRTLPIQRVQEVSSASPLPADPLSPSGLSSSLDSSSPSDLSSLDSSSPDFSAESGLWNERRPGLRVLGQIRQLYIVAESDQGLVLIDQHAAAERIRFERLVDLYQKRSIRQELAQPVTIEFSPSEEIMLSTWMEVLEDIGFEITPFGGRSYSVRSVPALRQRLESADAVHDILKDLFLKGKPGPDSSSRDEILRLLACRGSIKSGRKLTAGEIRRLIEELGQCNNPLTCPHGRPVMITMDEGELERIFARR